MTPSFFFFFFVELKNCANINLKKRRRNRYVVLQKKKNSVSKKFYTSLIVKFYIFSLSTVTKLLSNKT